MNPLRVRALLRDATQAGVTLWVEDNRLRCKALAGDIPTALRTDLMTMKDEIVMALDRPDFTKAGQIATQLRLPESWIDFWRETEANPFIANQTNITFRISGAISTESLHAAFDALASRHDVLRARVSIVDGAPCLQYDRRERLPVQVVDLCVEDSTSRSRSLQEIVDRTIWTPFERGSLLFRACVVRVSVNECIVAFVLHHFVGDFDSCQILATEFVAMLPADRRRKLLAGPRPLQYSDYHRAMEEWALGAGLTYRLTYWKQRMENAPPTRLPRDFEPSADSSPAPVDGVPFAVDEILRARMASLAGSSRVTVATIVLAATFVPLSSVIQREDVVITMISSTRDPPAVFRMVGMTVNCIPIRVCVSRDMSFVSLVTRVNEAVEVARDYQVPWSVLARALQEQNASCVAPVFNFVAHRHGAEAGLSSLLQTDAGNGSIAVKKPRETVAVSWKSHTINVVDTGKAISGALKYAPAEYRKETLERFKQRLLQCMRQLLDDPARSVGEATAQ